MSEHVSESEQAEELDAEGRLTEALDNLSDEVPEDYPQIDNDCWVTVQLKINDFRGTPEDAVAEAMLDFITFGLYDRVVIVHDPGAEKDYAVLQGTVLSAAEIDELRKR